jgi:pimeloyl-ACP methyl ester carboxylesterase
MIHRHAATRAMFLFSVTLALAAAPGARAGVPGVVASADGTPIAYEVHGGGEPTLVLVHGWSCDSRYWREQVPVFSARHRVVTVDLAGHGHSGQGRGAYTMRAFGEDVRAVADAVGGDSFILVGHSMGGLVVAEAARLLPGRVLGLVAVDALHDLDYPVTEAHAAEMIAPLEADFPAACRQFAAGMIRPDTSPDLAAWIPADMAAAPREVALGAMRDYLDQWVTGAGPALFKELPLPVVAVCADMWPVDAEANRRFMHSFEAIVLEGTDHFLMLAAPRRFNGALARAVAMLGSPAAVGPLDGQFDPENVLVTVESHNGWGKSTVSGLSCDGRFSIVGAFSDTTTIRGTVDPDTALALVNELLALNFFEQPARFGPRRLQLAHQGAGRLAYLEEITVDAGSTEITLYVGGQSHGVVLASPAHGAPEALREWVRRFRRFMKQNQGW